MSFVEQLLTVRVLGEAIAPGLRRVRWTTGNPRSATLSDVVTHYDTVFSLDLTAQQQSDLIDYLKSL